MMDYTSSSRTDKIA